MEGTGIGFMSNKWIATALSIWIQCVSGASYTFSIYSAALKSTQGYDQSTLDTVSVFKDIGANAGVVSGFLYTAVTPATPRRSSPARFLSGPWIVHAGGAIQWFVGYIFIWAAVSGVIDRPPVPAMCFFMFLAAHAQTFFNTANVVTGVHNFAHYSGTIVGIMKGYLGLSGALLIQVYNTFCNGEPSNLLLMLAVLPTLLSLLVMWFVRIDKTETSNEMKHLNSLSALAVILAFYLMIVIILENTFPLSSWTRLLTFSILLILLAAPLGISINAQREDFGGSPTMEVGRVQDIASAVLSSGSLPAEFVRSETEQPGITTVKGETLAVPVIDFSDPDEASVLRAIDDASRNWGMFQIVNHEIPNQVIANLQAVGKHFFELPQEEKELYAKPPGSKSIEGYGTKLEKEIDGKKGWVDHLFHIIWPPSDINYKFWPQNPPSYRAANEEYRKHLHGVVDKLFKSLSLGLGLEPHELKEGAGGDELVYLLKINYYPPCPRPDLALGVPAHTDMSAITILVPNEVQGLQAFRDGHWYDVKYIPNALVIHIGDQIEILSNGKYKGVFHRTTVDKDKTRISWPVFLEPPAEFEVGPHPKLVDEKNPAKYKRKKFGEYAYCKLNKIPQ